MTKERKFDQAYFDAAVARLKAMRASRPLRTEPHAWELALPEWDDDWFEDDEATTAIAIGLTNSSD